MPNLSRFMLNQLKLITSSKFSNKNLVQVSVLSVRVLCVLVAAERCDGKLFFKSSFIRDFNREFVRDL